MKSIVFSLFILLSASNLNAQSKSFSDYDALDSAVLEARLEIKRLIENNNFEPIRRIREQSLYHVVGGSSIFEGQINFQAAILTGREEVIINFLLKDYKNLLSGIVHLRDFFNVKAGAPAFIDTHKTPSFDSLNLTLDILPALKKINIDSIILADDICFVWEDAQLLKLYWNEILLYIEAKDKLPSQFKSNGEDYLNTQFEVDEYTIAFVKNRFVNLKKTYTLRSFNLNANYQYSYYYDSLKTKAIIKPGLDLNCGFTFRMFEFGAGYNFFNFSKSDSLFNNESLIALPNQLLTQNTIYVFGAMQLYQWKRFEANLNIKAGKTRVYEEKRKIYNIDMLSYGLDFKFNLSKYYKPQINLLKYKNEEYTQKYSPVFLKISPEFQVDVLTPKKDNRAVLFNVRIGLVWQLGKFKPLYRSNQKKYFR